MKLYGNRHHACRINEYQWRRHSLLVMENELVRVTVLASKGADILEFRHKPSDTDVLWHAPQPVLPPTFVPTKARPGGAFLDYYPGGWQEIFPSAGHSVNISGAELGQHGEVSLQPWDVRVIEDKAERVTVEFSVETIRTPFRLVRAMTLQTGDSTLFLKETATNLGAEKLPYAWGHHPVFGAPFLEAGCEIDFPASDTGPAHTQSVPSIDARSERVICLENVQEGRFRLGNRRLGLAAEMRWDKAIMPYLWSWQVYGGSWHYPYFGRAYCLGIEPFSCPVQPFEDTIAQGRAPQLDANGERALQAEMRLIKL
ncbi:MAG TPA: aldose 1-epimerase [Bryobacteraceae bacterium]|nr:aldose 1-epimerase [Bryobacteraceae bacterium]